MEERGKGGREIGIVGYECQEGVGVAWIGGSGGKPRRLVPGGKGVHSGGRIGRMCVVDGRWIKGGGGVVDVRGGGCFFSAGGRCGIVHGGGGGKGGGVERERCCFGGNESDAGENLVLRGGVLVKLRSDLFDYTWELV